MTVMKGFCAPLRHGFANAFCRLRSRRTGDEGTRSADCRDGGADICDGGAF